MSNDFYRSFEEKFRGSRELVKLRLEVYLPLIKTLREYWTTPTAIDLGCGRGEWLELLNENGYDAHGVDINNAMLAACHELGLKTHSGDALKFLKNLPNASQSLISGFHIIEHISFESLQELISEALRTLKPGGVLILETPNPENIVVGTSTFYLDPSHQRPIPPQALEFLSTFTGFKRNKILRLQESTELSNNTDISLLNVLNGVSPDYALLAQKEGSEDLFSLLTPVFDTEYGLTLEALADKYQFQSEEKIQKVEAHIDALINSTSWRITAPLRAIISLWHRLKSSFYH